MCNKSAERISQTSSKEIENSVYAGIKIVTEIILITEGKENVPIKEEINSAFWTAEKYHQNYFFKNGHVPYCQFVILPKLEKAKELVKKININE